MTPRKVTLTPQINIWGIMMAPNFSYPFCILSFNFLTGTKLRGERGLHPVPKRNFQSSQPPPPEMLNFIHFLRKAFSLQPDSSVSRIGRESNKQKLFIQKLHVSVRSLSMLLYTNLRIHVLLWTGLKKMLSGGLLSLHGFSLYGFMNLW